MTSPRHWKDLDIILMAKGTCAKSKMVCYTINDFDPVLDNIEYSVISCNMFPTDPPPLFSYHFI